ncbi:MAG: class I SAM-dependent methyltransferase [Acidimicrobiales bacterium]
MSKVVTRNEFIDSRLSDYCAQHFTLPDEIVTDLRAATESLTGGRAGMAIGDDQAMLLEMLARSTRAELAIEIGTFTGMSALSIARGIGPGSRLICCDVSEEWTAIAREFWARAGLTDRIDLRIGPALETLAELDDLVFDLAYVDADKVNYPAYYEALVPRMRQGGILLADNTLQSGRVADPDANDESTLAMRIFNDRVASDERVRSVLLPIGDGVTFVEKR